MNKQEKRFIAVIGSMHKKPRAMFLSTTEGEAPAIWDCRARYAISPPLDKAIAYCKMAGVPEEGVYFIDADNITHMVDDYSDTEIKLSDFILMCANTNRQVIRYNREDLIPPIVTPSEQELTNEALSQMARDLAGAPQIITQQADDYAQIVIEKKFIAIHRVPQVGGDACYIWYKDGLKKRYQNEASELPLIFKLSEKESIIQRLKEQGAGECLLVEFTVNMREWLYRKSYNTANVGITTEGDILYKKLLKKVKKLGMTTYSICQQGNMIMHSHDEKGNTVDIGVGEMKITQAEQSNIAIIDDGKRDDAKVLAQPKKDKEVESDSIILLRVDLGYGGNRSNYHWVTRVGVKYGEWQFKTCESVFDARPFSTIKEVDNYLGALPLDKYSVFVSEHNRQTRVIIGTGYIKKERTPAPEASNDVIDGLKQTFGDNPKVITLPKADLVEMLDNLPENRPLYKDSGLWQIRTDDMEEVLYEQGANESFFEFIERAFEKENFFKE